MKKSALLVIMLCILATLLCSCKNDDTGFDGSEKAALSLLNEMINSEMYSDILDYGYEYGSRAYLLGDHVDLSSPVSVYDVQVSDESTLLSIVKDIEYDDTQIVKKLDTDMICAIADRLNRKAGNDSIRLSRNLSLYYPFACDDIEKNIYRIYEYGDFCVLSVTKASADGIATIVPRIVFIDIDKDNPEYSIEIAFTAANVTCAVKKVK